MNLWKAKRKLKRPAMSPRKAKEARAKEARAKRKHDHVVHKGSTRRKAVQP